MTRLIQNNGRGNIMGETLLQVTNLTTRFHSRGNLIHAVNGVSFKIDKGETLGVVGESGCGKSVTMLSMLHLLPPAARVVAGTAFFHDKDLLKLNSREMQRIRGNHIGMIFQDPMTSFNPVLTIGDQVGESLIYHNISNRAGAEKRVIELFRMVGIPDPEARLKDYPHQFSGGMRQRAMIAMALACEPELVIADEPTTALDVTIQAQIVEVVKDLRDRLGIAIIWITHDLSLVAGLADRIMVMYAGNVIEEATTEDLFDQPTHPYTLGLLAALPAFQASKNSKRLSSIPGSPPDLRAEPTSCPFLPRCSYAINRCAIEMPLAHEIPGNGSTPHSVACFVNTQERITVQ